MSESLPSSFIVPPERPDPLGLEGLGFAPAENNGCLEVAVLAAPAEVADIQVTREYKVREKAIHDIVRGYCRHPQVMLRVSRAQKEEGGLRWFAPNTLSEDQRNFSGSFPLLDANQEREFIRLIDEGLVAYFAASSIVDDTPEQALIDLTFARQVLFLSNQGLVRSLARRYSYSGMVPLIDLVQEGNQGLDRAIARFNPTRDFKFSTYATDWINQALGRAVADLGRTIRLPVHAHEGWLKIKRHVAELTADLGREPTDEEIATSTKLSVDNVQSYRGMSANHLLSLDRRRDASDPKSDTLGDILPDHRFDPATRLEGKMPITWLLYGPGLTDTQKLVLCLRHGLFDAIPPDLDVQKPSGAPVAYQKEIGKNTERITSAEGLEFPTIGRLFGITKEQAEAMVRAAEQTARSVLTDLLHSNESP